MAGAHRTAIQLKHYIPASKRLMRWLGELKRPSDILGHNRAERPHGGTGNFSFRTNDERVCHSAPETCKLHILLFPREKKVADPSISLEASMASRQDTVTPSRKLRWI